MNGNDLFEGLNFRQLYGAGSGGVDEAQDVMKYLSSLLIEQAGDEPGWGNWQGSGEDYPWMGPGSFGSIGSGYNLEDWMSYLDPEKTYGQSQIKYAGGGSFGGGTAEDMSSDLLSLLLGSKIPGLMRGYGQSAGDIGTEISAQTNLLSKTLGGKGKQSRYGSLVTGGRSFKGGKRDYLDQYYDLAEKEAKMLTGEQEETLGDFYTNIGRWQTVYG